VLAIDTSGSMSDRDLGLVLGEVDAIRRSCACELTVLQFDADIHATAEFNRWSDTDDTIGSTKVMRVFGRGGTDLRLPFAWAEEQRRKGRRISALIVCTDGFGPLPQKAPSGLPVLFMLTPHHQAPGFGERVVLRR
jgi:predicted metal-dependent peptidase